MRGSFDYGFPLVRFSRLFRPGIRGRSSVRERSHPGKVVCGDHRLRLQGANRGHRRIEHRCRFWHLREVLENGHGKDMVKSRLTGSDAVPKVSPWAPRALVPYESRIAAERLGRVSAE